MTDLFKCPVCGCEEFNQNRTVSYDELYVVSFSSRGEIEYERREDQEINGEEAFEAYWCKSCDWVLVDEAGEPITEPDEIMAAIEHYKKNKNRKPAGDPGDTPICDECGNHLSDIAIDAAMKEADSDR